MQGLKDVAVTPGELVRRARDEGDEAAWAALVERFSGLLWSVARAYGLDSADAGDVAQTTWLRLVERLDRIRDPEAVGGWLAVTARRECERLLRHRVPVRRPEPVLEPSPGPDQVAVERERLSRVAEALRQLPPRCRNLLRLLARPGSTYAETAAALGIPIGGIGPTRARCLDALRKKLAGA